MAGLHENKEPFLKSESNFKINKKISLFVCVT